MDLLLDGATWVLLLAGSFFLVITGIGLLKFPDLYTRIHAGGMADTLATFLICLGLGLQSGLSLVTVKLAFVVAFVFFTSPTATYALAQASFVAGLKPKLDGFSSAPKGNSDASTEE